MERRLQMVSPLSVIAKHTPVLEPGDRVLDPCTAASVPPPPMITHDAIMPKSRRDELRDTAVSAVGEHTTVPLTPHLHGRPAIVGRVVAIARATRRGRDDEEIAPAHQDLRIARPPVVLGLRGTAMITGGNERAVDDPRPSGDRDSPPRPPRPAVAS